MLRQLQLVAAKQPKNPLSTTRWVATSRRIVKIRKEPTPLSATKPAPAANSNATASPTEAQAPKETPVSTFAAPIASPLPSFVTADSAPAVKDTGYFPGTDQFDTPMSEPEGAQNWSTSFHGLSTQPFVPEVTNILLEPVNSDDIEIKPDGLIYLPEIKYRRILNKAFGPGGWGLAPRGEHSISQKNISREYALVCHGRFVSQARGEQDFFDVSGLPTASEGCKSNALMRCCKDLGIASELWDPVFIRKFKKKYCVEVWAEHVTTKRKKKLWRKKDDTLDYPYKESSMA